MKKIIFFGLIALAISVLHANGACLLQDLKKNSTCTGKAASIKNPDTIPQDTTQNNIEDLKQIYQIPTLSVPSPTKNGFPILNPQTNCMFGMCQPR